MSRARRPDYDSPRFERDWRGEEPLKVIAHRYGVSITSLYEAAQRRGLTPRREAWQDRGDAG